MSNFKKEPFTVEILNDPLILSEYDNHIKRYLSNMRGYFQNEQAYSTLLQEEDALIYEVYEIRRPEAAGEMMHGLSIVHPGMIGNEYFMTKGHFHSVLETGEVYYCLRGQGVMVMETPEGEWSIERLYPGSVLYVPPRWAHRSVNTGIKTDLVTFFVYPANAGHDYGSIEKQGFRKLVMRENEKPSYVDNPYWVSPEERS